MKRLSLAFFLRDRLLFIVMTLLIIALSIILLLLERDRYPAFIELGTIYYFIVLSLFFLALWLVIDYLRQRAYFIELHEAAERSDELQAVEIVTSTITMEQKLVARLLAEQNRAYLNELGKYRRQQELHNHFVLQWVHHMKTPLSVIDLLAQQTLQQNLSALEEQEEQKLLALSLQEETERMTRGLEMMLYTARLDKFEIDLHIKRIAVHELARTVINAHKKLCIRHSIFPRIEGELWVETDEKWMTFLLNQFISNAIKYSKGKHGAKKLLFQLEQTDDGGGKLAIKDEGIGIASHDLPRVFDPFFTGENGRIAGESTGMGLYLAKQVCHRLGHAMSIASELGVSTTITLAFKPRGIHILDKSGDRNEG